MSDTHWLFCYGTFQDEDVQLATFGRRLGGTSDALPGFRTEMVDLTDPSAAANTGGTHHPIVHQPIVVFTGDDADTVDGTVFAITDDELERADEHEVADYTRVGVVLASGIDSWVYVQAG